MEETTAVVYAADDEEDILRVRDLLEREGITCALIMRSDNYLYGPGILNEGLPLLAGKYAIQVHPDDQERSLALIEDGQSPTVTEAPAGAAAVPQPSKETIGASSSTETPPVARPARLVESIVFAAIFLVAAIGISEALYLVGFRFRLWATVDIFVRIAAFMIVAAVIKNRLHRPALEMAALVPGPLSTYALTIAGYVGIFLLLPLLMGFLLTLSPSMSARSKLPKGSTFQVTLLERCFARLL